ncbi:hypothetical protein T10_5560 [Trichinella papuae]|uniref:Uncharacterized protein n=1 Tax=Trichinella papuae TaxID=268474 RepID=A0A0V1MDJ5_9BILA|nr:hypothetical protein T10_5560 [Trichinella papuae]
MVEVGHLFRHYWIYHGEGLHDMRKLPNFTIEMKKAEFLAKADHRSRNDMYKDVSTVDNGVFVEILPIKTLSEKVFNGG